MNPITTKHNNNTFQLEKQPIKMGKIKNYKNKNFNLNNLMKRKIYKSKFVVMKKTWIYYQYIIIKKLIL